MIADTVSVYQKHTSLTNEKLVLIQACMHDIHHGMIFSRAVGARHTLFSRCPPPPHFFDPLCD